VPSIRVEFFGIPRLRAGRPSLTVEAGVIGELLDGIARECPGFRDACLSAGALRPEYLLSIGGHRFTRDRTTPLSAGDDVLIFSADVGG